MAMRTADMDPIEIVDLLKEKLRKAKEEGKFSKEELGNLMPASLRRRDQHSIPAYNVGSLRKQQGESKAKTSTKQGSQRKVPIGQLQKYMKQFADAKAQGRFSHLSDAMVKKLEDEVRVSASDPSKTAELEEFFRSVCSEDME